MSVPSEQILNEQPLYTPPQVYRELLHSAREADRRHISGVDQSILETDYGDVQFESYIDDGSYQDDDYGDILESAMPSGYRYRIPEEESVDLEAVLQEGAIDWDAPVAALESSRLSAVSGMSIPLDEGELLEDSYFPGYLDDAVNGKVPVMEGMTLLEAFDRRAEHELKQVRERLGLSHTSRVSEADVSRMSEPGMDSSVREEDIMAAIVGVRIDQKIRNLTETELTKAIDGLMNVEFMHEFNVKYEVMQRMSRQVVGQLVPEKDKEESAAAAGSPIGKKYPKFDVVNVGDEESGRPLEIVTYIGSTRSRN